MDFSTNTGASPGSGLLPAVDGDFQTQLTVRTTLRTSVQLADWAAAQGLTLTPTVLDRGRTPGRPTLTRRGTGSFEEQRRAADADAALLAEAGFAVVRTRIEAAAWNDGVPLTDTEAAALPPHCHFEHRVTLRLAIPYDTKRLAALAERHSAQVARTARRVLSPGVQERSVVQRVPGAGRTGARARLDGLLDALFSAGFQPADVEEGFVLLDDNPPFSWPGRT